MSVMLTVVRGSRMGICLLELVEVFNELMVCVLVARIFPLLYPYVYILFDFTFHIPFITISN